MKHHFKKYFIPHEENEYKSHLLRETAVTILALLALAVFVFSSIHTALLITSSEFLAAVLPRVLVDLTNEDRIANDIAQLSINPVLDEAAQLKADHMAENGYFAHVSPDGTTPWHWFVEAGYQFAAAGENLAVNFSDSEDVVEAWLNSPSHRANILNGEFTEIGIATARGEYNGRETVFVVQLFGRPAPVQAAPVPEVVLDASTEVVAEPEAALAAASETIGEAIVPETLEVIREDDMFIAVRDTALEEQTGSELAGAEAVGLLAPVQTSFVERLVAQPRTLLDGLYLALGALVLIALILNVVVEVKHQHPLHTTYGVLLLVLIVSLAYLSRSVVFADLLIL